MTIPIIEISVVEAIIAALAAAGTLLGVAALLRIRRQRIGLTVELKNIHEEADRNHQECLRKIHEIWENLTASEKNAQANLELLRDGRLGMPARARALQMLRTGMAAETAAVELSLPRNEVQLLEKIAIVLASRN